MDKSSAVDIVRFYVQNVFYLLLKITVVYYIYNVAACVLKQTFINILSLEHFYGLFFIIVLKIRFKIFLELLRCQIAANVSVTILCHFLNISEGISIRKLD